MGYFFQLSSFFYIHHPTDRIAYTMAFVTPVVERERTQWVHHEDRSNNPMYYVLQYGLLLPIINFFYIHHPTDRIAYTMAFVTPVVERERTQGVHHERSIQQPNVLCAAIWATSSNYQVFLYTPFYRQDSIYYGLCYTSRGTRKNSMGPP